MPPSPPQSDPPLRPVPATHPRQPLAPEDFYLEGSSIVFTAAYHLKRGTCCNSNCRHCPYGTFSNLEP